MRSEKARLCRCARDRRGRRAIRTNAPTGSHGIRLSNAAQGHSRHSGRATDTQLS